MTDRSERLRHPHGLSAQLDWFVRLRWLAAGATVAGALVDWWWLQWSGRSLVVLAIGLLIFVYNVGLWWLLKLARSRMAAARRSTGIAPPPATLSARKGLLGLAWVQLLLDLLCLTALVLLTGGLLSPLVGFYVFHMVFASLLLPRRIGYAGATTAWLMLVAGLLITRNWPDDQQGRLFLAGLAITLVLTVYLTEHLTLGLRRQRRHLILQNRRIRSMAGRLRQQHQAMIQHEKMVAMGHMAAGITHEIANPLASMDSLLQLAQRKPERLGLEMVQTLREQVGRINRIVQQMKTFARPADMQPQTVPLNRLIEQALDMLRFDRRLDRVKVEKELSPEVGQITVLPLALEQVLVNLIQNALDAMLLPNGAADGPPDRLPAVASPQLVLRSARQGDHVFVEVSDNGIGIPPEHRDRLFEPFFTTKPVGKGTGLGLSISYSLVQKLGGSITVHSRPGQGTTFTIRLPGDGN